MTRTLNAGSKAFLLVISAVNGAGLAGAQTPSTQSTTVPTREQVAPQGTPADKSASRARVTSDNAMPSGPCPLPDDLTVAIREVRFTAPGGGRLDPRLATLLTGIGTTPESQSIKVICSLRDRAIERLRLSRYVASVQVPQQRIDDGVLRLEVVSGRIVEVRVRGDAGPSEDILRARIAQLKALDPLNEGDAERILLLADDIPGLNIEMGLSPAGTQPGDLIGELRVSYRRFSMVANVQNYNSAALGRESLYVRAELAGLTGLGDRTYLAASSTFNFKTQRILQLYHSMLLDSSGTSLALVGTLAESRPELKTIDLRTLSSVLSFEVAHPLMRSVRTNAEVAGGFEWAQQRTRVYSSAGSSPLNRDRIPVFFLRGAISTRKLDLSGRETARAGFTLEARQGLGVLGATKPATVVDGYTPTHFEGGAVATVVRAKVDGQIGLGPIFELAAQGRAQWANRPLLNYDEFAIGNLTIGRGYDPGANTGDRAIGASIEARASIPVGQKAQAQLFGFYDQVHLWNLDLNTTESSRNLRSLGGGMRLNLFNSMRLEASYTHPLDPPLLAGTNIKRAPDRVLFSLTAQIVPFGTQR